MQDAEGIYSMADLHRLIGNTDFTVVILIVLIQSFVERTRYLNKRDWSSYYDVSEQQMYLALMCYIACSSFYETCSFCVFVFCQLSYFRAGCLLGL